MVRKVYNVPNNWKRENIIQPIKDKKRKQRRQNIPNKTIKRSYNYNFNKVASETFLFDYPQKKNLTGSSNYI